MMHHILGQKNILVTASAKNKFVFVNYEPLINLKSGIWLNKHIYSSAQIMAHAGNIGANIDGLISAHIITIQISYFIHVDHQYNHHYVSL